MRLTVLNGVTPPYLPLIAAAKVSKIMTINTEILLEIYYTILKIIFVNCFLRTKLVSTNIVIRNKSKAERDMSKSYQLLKNDEPDWNEDEMPFRSDSTTDLESSSHDDVTKTNDKHPESPSSQNTSVWKSAFNIGNYMEGVGFLALPFAVAKGGVAAIVSLLLVPIILFYSGNILIECFYDDDKKRGRLRTRTSFKDLGDVLSPKYGGFLAVASQQLILLLTLISYIIVCGSLLEHSFPSVPLTQATWIVIVGVVVLPTAFLKTLSQIAWLSFVSIVGLTGVVVWGRTHGSVGRTFFTVLEH